MAEITVTETGSDSFRVVISDGRSTSEHEVSLGDRDRVPDGSTPAEFVEASFRFLLDREPKESILSRFELGVISRYFPEYEDQISGYL